MPGDQHTDLELMRMSRADARAFDELYVRHARSVHRWLAARMDEHGSWELTAETFAQAWISRKGFRAPNDGDASALPWLLGIAQNLHRRWARTQAIHARATRKLRMEFEITGGPDDEDDLARIDAAALRGELATSLAALPADQRSAVELRVVHELPYDLIAERLGCTNDVVRMRVMRGLRALRADLQELRS